MTAQRAMTDDEAIACARGALHSGYVAEAENVARQMLADDPDNVEASQLLAVCLGRRGALAEALPLFETVVRGEPGNAGAHNNLGSTLSNLGRYAEALPYFDAAIAIDPRAAVVHGNRGNALKELGRIDEALASYASAIALAPENARLRYNRGTVLIEMQHYDEALADLDRAVLLDPRHASSWLNRGNARFAVRRFEQALADYDQTLALEPANVRALVNRANALRELCRHDEALASCDGTLALAPGLAEAHAARGAVENDLARHGEALASYDRALATRPDLASAHAERAHALRELGRHDDALASYAAALALDPELPYALGNWMLEKLACCDWDGLAPAFARVVNALEGRVRVCTPFPLLAMPSTPEQQRRCARQLIETRYPRSPAIEGPFGTEGQGRIRIGYFSADFHNHATAHLVTGILERHDRTRFEITAFSFGPRTGDSWQQRIQRAVDRFVDVRDATEAAIAAQARALQIDIAIDLKGHTQHSRTGIFAARAAPLQASWLGYPGTLGAPYIDYLIADPTLIPPSHRRYFDEKIAYMPRSYQPNDSTKAIAADVPTRESCGLPATGLVFCCFNHSFKVLPEVFDVWMRLLGAVEGSVFWLLASNVAAVRNLRAEAVARGVAPSRLVFAPRTTLAAHLARHRHADLFLDTSPCNAHTTASDALWAGAPVVTCAGATFASRVAASLLHAVGLPELVAADLAAYESLAVELARHPQRLATLRAKLAANRATEPLFDTGRFARDIEALFTAMVERQRAGLPPDHLMANDADGHAPGTNDLPRAPGLERS